MTTGYQPRKNMQCSSIFHFVLFSLFFFYVAFCVQEKHFSKVGKGVVLNSINVLSNHSVVSRLECGLYCLRYETCLGFSYKSARIKYEDINCQLSKQSSLKKNDVDDGEWMYYKALPVVSLLKCVDDSACENGGVCVESCDGLICECDVKYEGQRCEQERVFKSCAEALNMSSDAKDGVYKIRTNNYTTSNYTRVYCQMTSVAGCAGGGWTMVMKINGSKSTFHYDSKFWMNNESFNIQAGQTAFDDFEETKLPTFWSTSFKELCIGLRVGNDLNFLSFSYPASSLYSLFADGKYRVTNVSREQWKSLVEKSSLQTYCRLQGFNVDTTFKRVRLGYVGNEQNHCSSTDSYIGLGSSFTPIPVNTAGNVGQSHSDNGHANIRAMGYILVR